MRFELGLEEAGGGPGNLKAPLDDRPAAYCRWRSYSAGCPIFLLDTVSRAPVSGLDRVDPRPPLWSLAAVKGQMTRPSAPLRSALQTAIVGFSCPPPPPSPIARLVGPLIAPQTCQNTPNQANAIQPISGHLWNAGLSVGPIIDFSSILTEEPHMKPNRFFLQSPLLLANHAGIRWIDRRQWRFWCSPALVGRNILPMLRPVRRLCSHKFLKWPDQRAFTRLNKKITVAGRRGQPAGASDVGHHPA